MIRRDFLRLAGAGAVLIAVPAGVAANARFDRAAQGLITRELHFLQHDPAGLDRFVRQYFSASGATDRVRIHVLHALRRTADDSWTIADMVREYLLGSDFFTDGMDEARIVTYTGRHSAWSGGCSNPFAMVYYPRS